MENHGLNSHDGVQVFKEMIMKEIKGLEVVPEIIEQEGCDENVDDHHVKDTISLFDIYQRCNVTIRKPPDHEEAFNDLN